MDRLRTIKCPVCNIKPCEYMTPGGAWHIECENEYREWHPTFKTSHIVNKIRAVKAWNENVSSYQKPKKPLNTHRQYKQKYESPLWVTYKDTYFYQCENCGFVLVPKQNKCPSCHKNMNMGE